MTGAITGYMDVAQLTLYAFWIFFAGLIYYLRREDRREGYPLQEKRHDGTIAYGSTAGMPKPKLFILPHGGTVMAPRREAPELVKARSAEGFGGSPLVPTGNPMLDGVGPAAYARRADTPDVTFDDHLLRIVPLRADREFFLATEDPDPRGMAVYGADRKLAGVVSEAWIDRSEIILRYLEVSVETSVGPRAVMLPMTMLNIDRGRRRINVRALTAAQFADVPGLRNPDQITLLEEDKILGYYGGGTLYATPSRAEPLI